MTYRLFLKPPTALPVRGEKGSRARSHNLFLSPTVLEVSG
jgi:hypothetical protein